MALFIASLGATVGTTAFAEGNVVPQATSEVKEQNNNKKHIIRVAHVVKATTPKGQAAEHFKTYLEAKFPGRVEVQVFADNKLFKDREETEALNLGAVDIILPTSPKVAAAYGASDFELLDLPFLFNSQVEVNKWVASPTARKLLDNVGKVNNKVVPLAFWPNDFRQMIGKHEFKQKSDFAKDRIRLESRSPTLLKMHEAFTTKEAISLAFGDLHAGLSGTGRVTVDSTDNVLANIYNSRLYEPATIMTMTNHSYMMYVVLANKRWFNTLPSDIQEGVRQVAIDAGSVNAKLIAEGNKKMMDDMKAKNVTVIDLTDAEKAEMRSWAKPVHTDFASRVNSELLNETYNTIKSAN